MKHIIKFPFDLYGEDVTRTFVGPFDSEEQAKAYLDSDPEKGDWPLGPTIYPLYPPALEDEEED
jgi:hypothetical protein